LTCNPFLFSSNVCKLRQDSCKKQYLIEIAYEGECDRCRLVNCPFHGTCIDNINLSSHSDNYSKPQCVCPPESACDDGEQHNTPVCGSDFISYSSECHMKIESCKAQKLITKLYNGYCDTCSNMKCDATSASHEQLCASDGNTYLNECFLKMEECNRKTKIEILYKGSCDHAHKITNDKRRQCEESCKFSGDCIYFSENDSYQCLCAKFECSEYKRLVLAQEKHVFRALFL
jgi:agrin